MENQEIPQGYRRNAKGALIPEASIKAIDKERDELVNDIVRKAEIVQEILKGFKNEVFGDISAFVELSAEQYGAQIGGKKGNVTVYSFDGKYRVQRAISEHLQFDERIMAAKALIEECLQDWTAGSRAELKAIIDRAFDVDKEGNLNTNKILALRRVNISDSRWVRAMDAISDSVQVVGSKSYIRIYKRVGDTDRYEPISLDLANV
ncbi:sulfate transporter [[Haemophilus] ducreyi]|uniref:Sulfate transporter n=1 Tax=Haemophilus ducreyi (strain 35000HP / ATCC 700724) TaxID=233412 RepID=Q7VPI1_HAEDU|nr:DUF3164 family protein [[Haemophilus] ducreyi]AAP95100.1 hypothetical protein HD_0097 [[Haemophilus] ducreyi 35000HP]AKO39055.1 sulfate transporter [[Haemophilus] ducreyi]ANF73137.1 sulfate transporter [[Haemophilus] ducreyi]ANF75074.1 sulfate transporter [[Haemophilus] ducreyi]ASE06736.1 DUF3164 domain-containing protein [[Haemophilus] ducreyi]